MIRIAILGAGYGGVHAAKTLHKHLKHRRDVEITLYDKNSFHTLRTELHEVAGGRCEPDSVRVSLEKIFGGLKVRVVVDRIQTIDFAQRSLRSEVAAYEYDYLVLGVGAEPEFFGIPGVEKNSFTLWSYDDALRLREHIIGQFLKASREPDVQKRRAILTLVVAGAGFTGIELFGELLEWKKALCREYLIDPAEVSVVNVEAMTDILPTLSKDLRAKAVRRIEKLGGSIRLNTAITEVTPEGFKVKSGEFVATETLIWTCGVRGCAFAGSLSFPNAPAVATAPLNPADQDLRFNIKKKARLATNGFLQSVDDQRVFVVGDVLWFHEKNRVLPQVVETALQTADLVAKNIAAEIESKPMAEFKSHYHGFLVSIGSQFAVADVMGVKLSGFWAMAMKHLVNLHYLWEVAGFNTCWGYLKHHFSDMSQDRSIVGSNLAAKSPMYWLLPLRLFLGAAWIFEGANKILQGWLNPAKDFVSWMYPTDTKAAATVSKVAHPLSSGFDLHQSIFSHPLKFFTWFLKTFVAWIPHQIVQLGMVSLELAIGLALLGGLFTVLAADASVVLCGVFIFAGLFRWDQLWFVFAAIALIGGAGKVAGLDYWVMPGLQHWWNKTRLAKKTYLYVDEPVKSKKRR